MTGTGEREYIVCKRTSDSGLIVESCNHISKSDIFQLRDEEKWLAERQDSKSGSSGRVSVGMV